MNYELMGELNLAVALKDDMFSNEKMASGPKSGPVFLLNGLATKLGPVAFENMVSAISGKQAGSGRAGLPMDMARAKATLTKQIPGSTPKQIDQLYGMIVKLGGFLAAKPASAAVRPGDAPAAAIAAHPVNVAVAAAVKAGATPQQVESVRQAAVLAEQQRIITTLAKYPGYKRNVATDDGSGFIPGYSDPGSSGGGGGGGGGYTVNEGGPSVTPVDAAPFGEPASVHEAASKLPWLLGAGAVLYFALK